jgi:hypothetical protein
VNEAIAFGLEALHHPALENLAFEEEVVVKQIKR